MKTLLRTLFLIFLAILASFSGCQKHDDGHKCNDPIKEWPFPGSASRWLFDPIKPGNTIRFKVYRRPNRSSPYVYLRDETFMIKDTGIQKDTEKNAHTALNCNEFMINDYLVANISGPESIGYKLQGGGFTILDISFKNKLFSIADYQYQSHQDSWHDSLLIGGQNYFYVKNFGGVDNTGYYVDSTYCFYNLQYGILKFIINDTLIYQRNLP